MKDFLTDLMPVEKTHRVQTERQSRAIAGLSRGGGQTLNISIPYLDQSALRRMREETAAGKPLGPRMMALNNR